MLNGIKKRSKLLFGVTIIVLLANSMHASAGVSWTQATVEIKVKNFHMAGTEVGKEEYYILIENNGQNYNNWYGQSYNDGYNDVSGDSTYTFTFTMQRSQSIHLFLMEHDSFHSDNMFDGYISINYNHASYNGIPLSGPFTLQNHDTTFSANSESLFHWDWKYTRGTDSLHYVNVEVSVTNLS